MSILFQAVPIETNTASYEGFKNAAEVEVFEKASFEKCSVFGIEATNRIKTYVFNNTAMATKVH